MYEDGVGDICPLSRLTRLVFAFSNEGYGMSDTPIFDGLVDEYKEWDKHYEQMVAPILTPTISFHFSPHVMKGSDLVTIESHEDATNLQVCKPTQVKSLAEKDEGRPQE